MKKGELRPGVYINFCDEFHIIDWECIKSHMDDEQDDAYKGIPLTEEWLIKFGFKRDGVHFAHKNIVIVYYAFGYALNARLASYYNETVSGFEIKIDYVHQLQNLYFALTGEELTINEKSPTI